MAQIKNIFTKSKMNLDLDERLIPKGEYRRAQNILISNSEDSDVGAIENIRGNELIDSITIPSSNKGGKVIGSYVDSNKERIFWFVSTFTGDNKDINNMSRATSDDFCAIVMKEKGNAAKVIASGYFFNFSKAHNITGVNIIGDSLYWTDNYNQPRQIDVEVANNNVNYYDCEEKVSILKVSPYMAPFLDNSNLASSNANEGDGYTLTTTDPNSSGTKSDYMQEKFIRFAYRYKFEDDTYSIISPFTQHVFKPLNAGLLTFGSHAANSTANEPVVPKNVAYTYLQGKVPIMQNAYDRVVMRIPLPTVAVSSGNAYVTEHETQTSLVSDTTYTNELKIKSIEILLRESGTASIQLVDTIDMDSAAIESPSPFGKYKVHPNNTRTYYRQTIQYVYKSKEPFKVLPEKQLIRTSDKAPVRAKGQEIVGNRLVYGNLTLGYDLPTDSDGKKGVKFILSSGAKGDTEHNNTIGHFYNHRNTYKYHNIKQRRTYQLGIVLSDRYGRKSPVIPSTYTLNNLSDTHTVQAIVDELHNKFGGNYSWSTLQASYGHALNVEFMDSYLVNDGISHVSNTLSTPSSKPHGWYSWNLVVKQTEQDYYNVYVQHPMNNWDVEQTEVTSWASANVYRDQITKGKWVDGEGSRSYFSLTNDNINKVPRSIKESDETKEGTSGSEVELYPKVVQINTANASNHYDSRMGNGSQGYIPVLSIGNATEQGLSSLSNAKREDNSSPPVVQDSFFPDNTRVYTFLADSSKNPIVAEIPNLKTEPVNVIGEITSAGTGSGGSHRATNNSSVDMPFGYPNSKDKGLTVFETKPFESNIDIYWETSTCGLVRDLNEHCDYASVAPSNIKITPTYYTDTYSASTTAGVKEDALSGAQIGELTATADTSLNGSAVITSFALLTASNDFDDGVDLTKFSIAYEDDESYVKVSTSQGSSANANTFNLNTGGSAIRVGRTILNELVARTVNSATLPSHFDSDGWYRVHLHKALSHHSSTTNNSTDKDTCVINVVDNKITQFLSGAGTSNLPTNINQKWMLKTNDVFAFYNSSRDSYKLGIRAIQTGGASNIAEITINITNTGPIINSTHTFYIPSNATSGYKPGNVTATNGSADTSNNSFGMTAADLTGTHASSFDLTPQLNQEGTWRLACNMNFNFTTIFGTPSNGVYSTSTELQWNVTDNGGLNAGAITPVIALLPIELITIQAYYGDTDLGENGTCTNAQTEASTTYYATKNTASSQATSTTLFEGNKIYTIYAGSVKTTLGAGTLVLYNGSDYIPYTINSSGVVTSVNDSCPIV